jgi:hypothetical protein
MKLTEHFALEEFACKHCGKIYSSDNALKLAEELEILRIAVKDRPIHIISGYRCPAHNATIGGAKNSLHLKNLAADIFVQDMTGPELFQAAVGIPPLNIRGYGIGETTLHVDLRIQHGLTIWFYDGVLRKNDKTVR